MARRRVHVPLNVFLNGRIVGVLRRESTGAIDFQYARDLARLGRHLPRLALAALARGPLYWRAGRQCLRQFASR